jgi:inosine-uridine nucleoside N-ribohydrolase
VTRFSLRFRTGSVLLTMMILAGAVTWRARGLAQTCLPPDEDALQMWVGDPAAPVAIILDTDFSEDVDDVGALAILHALADLGEADILGVMISSGDGQSPRAVDAVNTFYGRPDIPIGITRTPAFYPSSRYTFDLAVDFPNDIAGVPDAADLYREILSAQPDQSVTIVTVGFLTNLRHLLTSEADTISSLTGIELVQQKVSKLVVMGGHYPDSALHPNGVEYNFEMDAEAAHQVIQDWPTPIIFAGFELGVDIETGAPLIAATPASNPVRRAYELYTGGQNRSSWDLTAVHYAVRGTASVWQLCNQGANIVDQDGQNRWDILTIREQAYLTNSLPKDQIEMLLNDLLIQSPANTRAE